MGAQIRIVWSIYIPTYNMPLCCSRFTFPRRTVYDSRSVTPAKTLRNADNMKRRLADLSWITLFSGATVNNSQTDPIAPKSDCDEKLFHLKHHEVVERRRDDFPSGRALSREQIDTSRCLEDRDVAFRVIFVCLD